MEYGGVEFFPVSEDPDVLARVRAWDETGVGSDELGRFVCEELGLVPPRFRRSGRVPAVTLVFFPTGGECYVWDVHDLGDGAEGDVLEGRH